MGVFDIEGNDIGGNRSLQDTLVERGKYHGVQYYFVRINKKKYDGTTQFPFIIAPNGTGPATQSALEYARQHNYNIVINAGVFDMRQGSMTLKPLGILIINGQVVINEPLLDRPYAPLLIYENGDLGTCAADVEASSLTGVTSAVLGFGAIVEDYVGKTIDTYPGAYGGWDNDSQRMIIGQFGNGDYFILTAEGRGFDNSPVGWTIPDAIDFCVEHNAKFAYNLDGGGSTELVIGKKQLNTIYDETNGRIVPTFIVFNGTTTYGEPEE